MTTVFDKLDPVIRRFHEIEESMADPEVAAIFERVQELARERASLEELVDISNEYKEIIQEIADLESLIQEGTDPELVQMAKDELEPARENLEKLDQDLRVALIPKNPNDQRNVIIEVRAGTGGDVPVPERSERVGGCRLGYRWSAGFVCFG